ncbi:uncharacterized protein LOC119085479 [Bradysia coprophila]|uniref:uncharacterized protein LOC119085479 n=1 Tax=Bradysia coprophila TaxID=38358 RepID=UPI00187DD063|nr:uncharacterized protein LOC119085479 [Bradysia coprophila]
MTIQTSDQGPKKNCCPYCNKLQSKFARHIVDMHSDKPDVLELSKLSKGSKERKLRIDAIKKIGNSEHNSNPKLNKNLIIPSRRSNAKYNRKASDLDVCYECLGTYFKKSIAKHVCSRKVIKGDRSSAQLNRLVAGRIHERASASLHDITSVMLDDDIANTAKYDCLLVVYGNELCEQFGYEPHHKIVRDRLRMLSRLLVQLKRIEPDITDFASLYHPKYCDVVLEAIREDSGFRSSDRQFQKPWNATKSVTEVKRVGRVLSEECISKQNKELKEQTNDFLALFQSRAAIRVNKLARTTIITRIRNKEEDLPTDDDIQHFQRFLDKKRKQHFDDLKNEYTFAKWINLSEVTMVSLILFNRRRVGELENALTSEYTKRRRVTNKNDQLFRALTAEGKERVERYSRMNVRGKLENRAPIMLDPELEECVDIILYYRDKAGVPKENDLLFALPAINNRKKSHLMGSSTVAKLSVQCEADNPKTLRGTKFRKHFATFCATKELNDNILTDVAKYLGHSLLIHKEIYRGNDLNREVARMSALFEEASGHNEMHSENIVNSTQVDNEYTVGHAEINSGGSTWRRTR